MDDLARIARNNYNRAWRERNPGKHAEYIKNYWKRKADLLQLDIDKFSEAIIELYESGICETDIISRKLNISEFSVYIVISEFNKSNRGS